MTAPSPFEALASAEGRKLLEGLREFTEERVTDAAAYARAQTTPEIAAAALATAFARRRAIAASKFSRAAEMLFTRTGYEQSTSERVAAHRAERFAGCREVADLCCGIGADAIALACIVDRVSAVDIDADALACARANADALGVGSRVQIASGDALAFDLRGLDAAFADPSRRPGGVRVRSSHRYAPPLDAMLSRAAELPGRRLAVKVAPGLAFDDPIVRAALGDAPLEIELVSERGACKEAVLWCGDLARADGARRATVIDAAGVHVLDGDASERAPVRGFGAYVGEPDPAVIRAGLVAAACASPDTGVIDKRVAYLAADLPEPTPFVRWYPLLEAMPFSVKRVRAMLRARDTGHLVVKTRAFPLAPEEITALLKPVGEGHATLICTTVGEKKWALLCGTVGA
ncbi:MAG TPA: methyltransferase domain-containing protein [Casimicrobiaceae bacterium]